MRSQSQMINTNSMNLNDKINFEHRFWLQVLGDHLRFIENTLSSNEIKNLEMAKSLKQKADNLLQLVKQQSQLSNQLNDIINLVNDIKQFKLLILNLILTDKIKIGLTPTFINHMINELEEYQMILDSIYNTGQIPELNIINHHKLWLSDACGHTEALISDLDSTEKEWKNKIKVLKKKYEGLYNKANEFSGYLRSLTSFPPSILPLNNDSIDTTQIFIKMLKEIFESVKSKEILSRINVLMPDHMVREELYYLYKMGINVGDPTSPRLEL
jgi:hypothetical protein